MKDLDINIKMDLEESPADFAKKHPGFRITMDNCSTEEQEDYLSCEGGWGFLCPTCNDVCFPNYPCTCAEEKAVKNESKCTCAECGCAEEEICTCGPFYCGGNCESRKQWGNCICDDVHDAINMHLLNDKKPLVIEEDYGWCMHIIFVDWNKWDGKLDSTTDIYEIPGVRFDSLTHGYQVAQVAQTLAMLGNMPISICLGDEE